MGSFNYWTTRYALVSVIRLFSLHSNYSPTPDTIQQIFFRKSVKFNLTFFCIWFSLSSSWFVCFFIATFAHCVLCWISMNLICSLNVCIFRWFILFHFWMCFVADCCCCCWCCSEGGFFKAHLHFPKEYPLRPPRMKFVTEIWHPNIEKNGDVCISILHEPGDDKWGYEKASERWLPVHTVETILISVISMLADPNDESPANVDAAKEWREAYPEFKRKVARCVRKSQEDCS